MQVYNDELYHYGKIGMKWNNKQITGSKVEIGTKDTSQPIKEETFKNPINKNTAHPIKETLKNPLNVINNQGSKIVDKVISKKGVHPIKSESLRVNRLISKLQSSNK